MRFPALLLCTESQPKSGQNHWHGPWTVILPFMAEAWPAPGPRDMLGAQGGWLPTLADSPGREMAACVSTCIYTGQGWEALFGGETGEGGRAEP